ncbi:MAG: hypothetical protein AAF383_28365 [Cyanobacteria bacterium P01_A01_bin.83]
MDTEQTWRQAEDENTSPEILAKLAKSRKKNIRCCVAGNLNTPVGILEKLGEKFPDVVVANPIFSLLLLENPESKFVLVSLARASTTSREKLANNPHVSNAVIKQLNILNKNQQSSVYVKTISKINLARKKAEELSLDAANERSIRRMSKNHSYYIRQKLSKIENASINSIKELIEISEPYLCMNIEQIRQQAQDENTAPERLAELAKSKDYLTRQYVAGNPNTPIQTLINLGKEFPRAFIDNPIFDLLIIEDINFVNKIPLATLRSILRQKDCPKFILEQACDRAELEVQSQLISYLSLLQPQVAPEILKEKSLSISWLDRFTVAQNSNAPRDIVQKLANDANSLVCAAAKEKLNQL